MEKKFEDTTAFKLWSLFSAFGIFSTIYGDTKLDKKMMVVTHPNIVVIIWNLFLSFILSMTGLGLFLTIPAWRTYKKYNAKIPLIVYSISISAAIILWFLMIIGSECWSVDPNTGKCPD